MPATNQYYPFGTGGGSYTLTNAAYLALAARSSGFPAGILPKENINTALRQTSVMSTMLGQFIADVGLVNANDDGNIATLEANYIAALNAQIKSQINAGFIVYVGNPNGHVAGVQGAVGTQFPSVVWDTSNLIWWVCTTTGTTFTAVWTESGAVAAWPFWCPVGGGSTGNAIVLVPPGTMTLFAQGSAVSWQVSANNTGATTVQLVGGFGTYSLLKDSPTGPIALTGGELVNGNIVTARLGLTGNLHLVDTALGTAALANASSGTGTVAAVTGAVTTGHIPLYNDVGGTLKDGPVPSSTQTTMAAVQGAGAIVVNHLAIFKDTTGTIGDGGPANIAPAPAYYTFAQNNTVLGGGIYACDTRVGSGGPFTLKLPPAPSAGVICQFEDPFGSWGSNALTLDRNGSTIMGQVDNLVCNITGSVFQVIFDGINNTWTLE